MKITQQSLPYNGFLVLALVVATMVRVGEAVVCSELVSAGTACDAGPEGACRKECTNKHPDGQPACDGQNNCMCFYECPSPPSNKNCNFGLGRCSASCRDQCCNSNCASSHPAGVGFCDDSLGKQSSLCQCQFPC